MFGQHLRTINIIHIIIGIIIIVTTTKISSDNARPHSGAYFVYNQVGLNQANKLRKLYWYTMGQPMLTARKQRMGNFPMKPRYPSAPLPMAASYGSPMRNTYRNPYDVGLLANTLKSYMTPVVSLSTTSIPKILPNMRFQPSKQYDELSYDDTKRCTEKNMTISAKESSIIIPHNFKPLEISANNMSPQFTIAPITPLPIVPYESHTYFTLDDVVIPSSSDNLVYYKPERVESIFKVTPPPPPSPPPTFTTQRSKLSDNLALDLFGSDLFDILPMETTRDAIQTTMPWLPTARIIVKNETKMETKTTESVTLNQTVAKDIFDIIAEHRESTSLPEIQTLSNLKEEVCMTCVKTPLTTTFSTIINDVDDTKFEESIGSIRTIGNKRTKTVKENNNHVTISLKNPTSTSFSNLLATKMKIAQNHKKFPGITSKPTHKIAFSSHPVSTSTTTEAPQPRKSRRTKTYFRQRKVDSNITRLNSYNLTNAKATYAKILRPTTKTNVKHKIQLNVTESPSSAAPETRKPNTVRSTATSKPVSTTNLTETTALAAESAIMTISNANGRSLRGSRPTFRKRVTEPQKVLVQTTAIPQLPIELYFNKLTRTR